MVKRYEVESYMTSTVTEVVEAESEEEAKGFVLSALQSDYDMLDRPTDVIYGVLGVELLEEEEE